LSGCDHDLDTILNRFGTGTEIKQFSLMT
jgi:hypothetical protein